MPLDPQAKIFLDQVKTLANPSLHTLGAIKAREAFAERPALLAPEWVPMAAVVNRTIDTPDISIPVRIYTPIESTDLLPVFIFYHGGGMVIGTLDSYDTLCRQLASQSGCIVVSVDYRLAPEHKFPAAVDDAFAALVWTLAQAHSFGGDHSTIAIGGDSAGGSLAAVVAIMARDAPLPAIKFQLLIYPATAPHADSASHLAFANGFFLERETVLWFHHCYLRADKDREDFRYAPLIANTLRELPPALVIVATYDTLRDEGVAYAERLQASGVTVELQEYDGMFHPFVSLAGILDEGKRAITAAAKALREHLL
ncbi:MAG: acetyl esterase [Candidatus Endobugula sp.]|jgi:acetyl esterase